MQMPLTTVYLLLSSNDEPMTNLDAALRQLREHVIPLAVSSPYLTEARGETAGGGDYVNMALKCRTTRAPQEFKLNVLRPIEAALGRQRDTPGARSRVPIDLDILLWGDTPLEYGAKPWRSPSPEILRYAYAAVPLAEIAPGVRHPETGETIEAIAARLGTTGIRRLQNPSGL